MKKYLIAVAMLAALTIPASAQLSSQQQRMKDCNSQASGMSGDARKQFMSSCLSGAAAEPKKPNCVNGKPCGNSCIAKDKVCRSQRRARHRPADAARLVSPRALQVTAGTGRHERLTARKLLQTKNHDVEMSLRGVLRGFGLKV